MPRPHRIQLENAFYHVMNRGIEGKEIFHNDQSYEIFLEILQQACQKFEVVVHAYCLMPNHYHLLLQTKKANLAKFMQHLGGFYTQRFNKFIDRDGPIFRGRFKSILVQEDAYLLTLGRYIHRNPIALVKNLSSYKWSSYAAYINLVKCPIWLNKKHSLQILSGARHLYNCGYEGFVTTKWPSDKEEKNKKGSDPLYTKYEKFFT